MVAQAEIKADAKKIPRVKGVPFVGSTLEMAKDPAAFFVRAYRDYGPVSVSYTHLTLPTILLV